MRGRFDSWTGDALAWDDLHGEFDIHGSFQGIASEFAIALCGVTIADIEKRARNADWQIDGRPFDDFIEGHIPTPRPGVTGSGSGGRGGCCNADAAPPGFQRH